MAEPPDDLDRLLSIIHLARADRDKILRLEVAVQRIEAWERMYSHNRADERKILADERARFIKVVRRIINGQPEED